ncbi:acyl transferase/acyl hydrolase/lysophospholipase [Aspergillus caelatus]|uniref:Acyl transferase/acyl hydrolase/lysophospholipase n=1 Tax=Aspergillus caelatus TaxID=61420 RepID=A0A5N6ZJR4_9EURO|nr:acyl transferase/acyl hydrolase/lysophospholipase [Aspergillus caelatus]KAE8357463.1 acyl transferase/acyl hydrolase/lysophospholipase [Aspergillus caelatus]
MATTSLLCTSQPPGRRTIDASIGCRIFVQQLNAAGPYNQDTHDAIANIESALRVLQLYYDEHSKTGRWKTDITDNTDNTDNASIVAIVEGVLAEFEKIGFDKKSLSPFNKRTFIKDARESATGLKELKVQIFGLVKKITGFSGLSKDGGLPMPTLTYKRHITPDGVRLLSIDGGGVRGLVSLLVLGRIMDCIRNQELEESPTASNDDRAPADYFDLAGGTSTGGYKSLVHDEDQLLNPLQTYLHYAVPVVLGRPWYKGQPLEKAVNDLVGDKFPGQSAESATLLDPNGARCCKSFVCTFRKQDMETIRLRTYEPADPRILFFYPQCTISQAARATSAAPFYFPEARIGHNKFWDGGLTNNNPIDEVYDEKHLLFPDRGLNCVVSLGTGKCAKMMRSKNILARHPAVSKGGRILANVTNVEAKHRRFEQRMVIDHVQYFRFDPSTMGDDINLADVKQLVKLENYATTYLDTPPISALIQWCAQLLRYRG